MSAGRANKVPHQGEQRLRQGSSQGSTEAAGINVTQDIEVNEVYYMHDYAITRNGDGAVLTPNQTISMV